MTTAHSKSSLAGLPLSRKLALMAILLLAPALALGVMFYRAQNIELQATRLQLEGVQYVGPFVKLLGELNIHRDAAALALSRPEMGLSSVREAETQVDRAVQGLGQGQSELPKILQTDTLTSEIVEGWTTNLKTNWNGGDAMMSLDLHTLVMAQVNDVVRLVGRKSRGSASGEANTPYDYGLMFELPASLDSLGQLGAFGVALAGTKPTIEQWDRLAGLMQDARRTNETLRTVLLAAKKIPAEARDPKLTEATEAAVTAGDALLDATQEATGGRGRSFFQTDPLAFRALANRSVTALAVVQQGTMATVEASLRSRLSGLEFQRNSELVAALLLLSLAVGLGSVIAKTVGRQVEAMGLVFKRISEGDLDARASVVARDELGAFAHALNMVLDNTVALVQSREERDEIQDHVRKLLSEIEGVAQGDLTTEAEVSGGMTGAVAEAFNLMQVELRGLIGRVQASALAVNAAAAGARDATLRLADGSLAQSGQVMQATAAIDQMALSIQQVTNQAASAARIAQVAHQNAQLGANSARENIQGMGLVKRQVQEMDGLVRELSTSSAQIGDITQLIADISKRTSILALNASIQAAVAGDSGKGFGVVAEQVEELAMRSSDAVRRVAVLTKSIQTTTGAVSDALENATRQAASGEKLATEASSRLAEIEKVSSELAGVVESILSVCRQQSASSESISQSMGEISRVTQHTSAGAKNATSSIGELSHLMEELRGSVSRFRVPTAVS